MAGIRDFFNFFQQPTIQTKEAPQVVLSTTSTAHYRRDNYEAYADEGYRQNAIVYRCVNEISKGASSVPFRVLNADGDQLENHPSVQLINRPNPLQSYSEFMNALFGFLLLSGNTYLL